MFHSPSFFLLTLLRPPGSTFFPYTTLFRSRPGRRPRRRRGGYKTRGNASYEPRPLRAAPRGAREEALPRVRSEEHTSELQSRGHLVCRLLLEKKKEHLANMS